MRAAGIVLAFLVLLAVCIVLGAELRPFGFWRRRK